MDDDDYDDQVESDNFNEEVPLDDWEATYYYTSLRTALNAAEDTWLANDMVGSDPFDHAVADFIFMTLINSNGDVKIGNSLYHFDADGSIIIVSNGDCSEFASAKASATYSSQYVTRIFPSNDECVSYKNEHDEKPCNVDSRKFIWRIDFDTYIARSRAKTVARNFRYKNGSWKRAAAETTVYIGGTVWDNECDSDSPISYDEKTKKRKRIIAKRWLASTCKIKTEELQGIVTAVNDGAYIDETIDWP